MAQHSTDNSREITVIALQLDTHHIPKQVLIAVHLRDAQAERDDSTFVENNLNSRKFKPKSPTPETMKRIGKFYCLSRTDVDNLCSHYCGVQMGFCCPSQAAHEDEDEDEDDDDDDDDDEDVLAAAWSLPCLLRGIPATGESAEQEQNDFKTTIIYCASCHCKL
ncbi:hypothetical protein TURU_087722 [Turdus rufiventris]|nr:hypothetical protein TURU_087722 [Turdus rufiventris]